MKPGSNSPSSPLDGTMIKQQSASRELTRPPFKMMWHKTSSYSISLSLKHSMFISPSQLLRKHGWDGGGEQPVKLQTAGVQIWWEQLRMSSTLWLHWALVRSAHYCMSVLFELISGDPDPLAVWKADFIHFILLLLPLATTPKQPGGFSTSIPVGSSSSADSPSHSPSRPCQDDCMRPVRRLPVSDLPCLMSREQEEEGCG